MANSNSPHPSLFFLQAAWASFLENKEVVILLALLNAMAALSMPSPFRDLIIDGEAGSKALLASPEAAAEAAPMLLLAWLVLLVVGSVVTVILARIIVVGPNAVLDGGIAAMARRSLKVIARSFGAIFWILLYALPAFFFVGLFSNSAGPGANVLLVAFLLFWMIVVAASVISAFYASALAESVDRRLGVRKGWQALAGKKMDIAGAILILWVVLLLVLSIVDPLIVGIARTVLGSSAANVLSFAVTATLSGIVTFVLMAGTFFILGVTAPGLLALSAPPVVPLDPED